MMDSKIKIEKVLQKGINAHRAGDSKKARRYYSSVLEASPDRPEANHNMGILVKTEGRTSEALLYFKKAIVSKPDIMEYWISYILTLIELAEHEGAKRALVEAKAHGLDEASAKKLLEKILKDNESPGKTGLEENLKIILELYNQGSLEESLREAERTFPGNQSSFDLLNIMGVLSAKLNRFEDAADYIKKALSLRSDFAEGYNNLGNIYQKTKKLELAIASYRQGIEIDPSSADLYNNLGSALQEEGKTESALISLKKAIELDPKNARAYSNLAKTYKIKGDSESALKYYLEALKLKNDLSETHNNLGNLYQEKGEILSAIKCYEKAIELDPNGTESLTNLGLALQIIGEHNESIFSFDKALLKKGQDSRSILKIRSFLLKSLFATENKERLLKELEHLVSSGEKNAMIGSYYSKAKSRYGSEKGNPFCEYPLKYVIKKDLTKSYDFDNLFRKPALSVLQNNKVSCKFQSLLVHGEQTSGNILSGTSYFSEEAKTIIYREIRSYQQKFRSKKEGLIINWPKHYQLSGWLVRYKTGGSVLPHIHETGWLSGSIYINVPESKGPNGGNLFLSEDEKSFDSSGAAGDSQVVKVRTGTLCLFPASLHHCSIPSESSEERIVLAFDVIPA